MSRRLPVPALAASLALCLALFAGLQAPGLAFHAGDQLRMVHPSDAQRVTGPVVLRWKVSAEVARMVADRRAFFAVFVDRAPIAPGESLASLADDACVRAPDCPSRSWLAERNVHVTLSSAIRLPLLPAGGSGPGGAGHEAVVVLLRADGVRLGEQAGGVRFLTKEAGA